MNVWKIGSRWDTYGDPNKSIIDIFRNNNIVFAGRNTEYIERSVEIGDLIVVADGITIVAVGKIDSKPKRLNQFEDENFENELKRYKIDFNDEWTIGYKVKKLYNFEREERFDYVRGTFNKVHEPYKNKIIKIFKNRRDMNIKSENQEIKLKSLELKNIKRFENIKINFNKKVTCIIAENGIGKTTILSSLALAICGVDANTIIKDNDYNAYKLIKNELLRIENFKDNEIDLDKTKEYSKFGYIKLNYKINNLYINKINFKKEDIKGITVKDSTEENKSFGINKDKNYFKTLMLGFPQGQARYKEKDFGFAHDTTPNISDIYSLITGKTEEKLFAFSKWLNKIYSEDKQNIKNIKIVTIFKIISKIVAKDNPKAVTLKSIKYDDNGEPVLIVKTPDNPEGISLELISQGLSNVFTWLGHFMQRIYESYPKIENVAKVHAILIIDEIDKYLHPKWQKRILKVLLEVFTNTQFIITTHSPIVLSGLEKGQVARIKLDENGKPTVEYNETDIWGWYYQNILERWMLKHDPYEYNLNEEEKKLEKLIGNNASEEDIANKKDVIFRIKESYEAQDYLNEYKKERLKRENELKEKNTALKIIIKELRKENQNYKNKLENL